MIKSITATWFETKIRAKKVADNGLLQTVTETYAVDAVSWGDAEKRIAEEMLPYYEPDKFEIVDIKKATYSEAFFDDSTDADKWYKCKVAFIIIDETTAKEKRNNVYYLVQAKNIDKAKANIDAVMQGTMIDYEVVSVAETKILETYAYHSFKVKTSESVAKKKPSASAVEALKNFEENIPEGQKVTASTDTSSHKVVIDKTTKKEIPKNE